MRATDWYVCAGTLHVDGTFSGRGAASAKIGVGHWKLTLGDEDSCVDGEVVIMATVHSAVCFEVTTEHVDAKRFDVRAFNVAGVAADTEVEILVMRFAP